MNWRQNLNRFNLLFIRIESRRVRLIEMKKLSYIVFSFKFTFLR